MSDPRAGCWVLLPAQADCFPQYPVGSVAQGVTKLLRTAAEPQKAQQCPKGRTNPAEAQPVPAWV